MFSTSTILMHMSKLLHSNIKGIPKTLHFKDSLNNTEKKSKC